MSAILKNRRKVGYEVRGKKLCIDCANGERGTVLTEVQPCFSCGKVMVHSEDPTISSAEEVKTYLVA